MARLLVSLVMVAVFSGSMAGAAQRESAEQRAAREAVAELRRSTQLVTECERTFLRFWRVYVGPGRKGLVRTPDFDAMGDYFGYGALVSAPLLAEAEQVCARQTGARGAYVVLVLKEREDAKRKRQEKLRHAERIIGY